MNKLIVFAVGMLLLIFFSLTSCSKDQLDQQQVTEDTQIDFRASDPFMTVQNSGAQLRIDFAPPGVSGIDKVRFDVNTQWRDYDDEDWLTGCCGLEELTAVSGGLYYLNTHYCVDEAGDTGCSVYHQLFLDNIWNDTDLDAYIEVWGSYSTDNGSTWTDYGWIDCTTCCNDRTPLDGC